MHMNLIDAFFHNAAGILRPDGEIHISHKTSHPFCNWNLNKLASKNSLALLQCVDFNISDYPGYDNKRGSGSRCDDPFPLGECSTFKFIISASAVRKSKNLAHFNTEIAPVHQFLQVPPQQSPIFLSSMTKIAWFLASRMGDSLREQCFHDFDCYFRHVRAILGFCDHNVRHVVQEALKRGYKRYLKESCETTSKGYVVLPEELHQLSISSRLAWLEMTLAINT
ncbi:hypothetical protein Nepgr_007678 [Nepenthes gracilis]|uniref:25S rRNA (uridine-N(3))-methyltransferase BMT5-like domain-containing protein n=1 Tax=Nepenthes gracilis TaxID=150966 RepID=A0AAD3S7B5_NEPGR|nr:hypothetical protein Nepgr_007678 [Nepenthes gracilis]